MKQSLRKRHPLARRVHGAIWYIWGFPKIRGTILGVPMTRTIVFLGLYWGPLILGNYNILGPQSREMGSPLNPKYMPHYTCMDPLGRGGYMGFPVGFVSVGLSGPWLPGALLKTEDIFLKKRRFHPKIQNLNVSNGPVFHQL